MNESTLGIEELKNKIINWVNNDRLTKFHVIDEEGKYDPEKYPFLLKVQTPNKIGVIYIYKSKNYNDKIGVYTGIDFTGENKVSFDALDNSFKEKILLEIVNGITMMNLVITFYPDYLNVKRIYFQDIIYYDGLSKDRIMNSLTKVLNAYGFIIVIMQKYGILRQQFDPSSFI
jgi:hypothetical protein